eukprot:scaffold31002_cov68-Phaeocystis_antarctica.AAC.5
MHGRCRRVVSVEDESSSVSTGRRARFLRLGRCLRLEKMTPTTGLSRLCSVVGGVAALCSVVGGVAGIVGRLGQHARVLRQHRARWLACYHPSVRLTCSAVRLTAKHSLGSVVNSLCVFGTPKGAVAKTLCR